MLNPRPLKFNELLFLSKTNKFLQFYFNTKDPMCCIAGGYLHSDRPAKDVDLFVYAPEITVLDSNSFYYSLRLFFNRSGWNMKDDIKVITTKSAGGKSYIFQFDIFLNGMFDGLPIQVIVFNHPIKEIIDSRFPLSIQQQAYIPNCIPGVAEFYASDLCVKLSGSGVCALINQERSNTERYKEKYQGYYPKMEFV